MATHVYICLCALLSFKNTCGMFTELFVSQLFFCVSIVGSRKRKRLKGCIHKRRGIVCRTMYVLCTHLCNDYSVLLISCFLHVVTYLSSYYSCLNTDAKMVVICEFFFIKAMICLCPFNAKWDLKYLIVSLCLLSVCLKYFVCISCHIHFSDHHDSVVV